MNNWILAAAIVIGCLLNAAAINLEWGVATPVECEDSTDVLYA